MALDRFFLWLFTFAFIGGTLCIIFRSPSLYDLREPIWFTRNDWKFVSMVLDRFFLWLFTLSCIGGTLGIIFQSPSLYDLRPPIDQQFSEIPLRKNNFMLPPDIIRMKLD
uniref:Uncharacterized protein n=1 Tax=Lutzomyia longipalpis TaxID=7200 RepID=A0A1B0CAP0_LUTLO